MRATWLGQAGLRLETDGASFGIDPWVTDHEDRLVAPPPLRLAADRVDWLLLTHEHLDHLDLPLLPDVLNRSPQSRIVLPAPAADLVRHVVPQDRIVRVAPGDSMDLGGATITVVPAFHGLTMADAYGDGSGVGGSPRFVGYVIGEKARAYHAGDTVVTDELRDTLEPLGVDVAFLPINGRDAEREARGIVGNMDAVEAVELAIALGARCLVPIHWDGVSGNTADPDDAVRAARGRIDVLVPTRFEPFEI